MKITKKYRSNNLVTIGNFKLNSNFLEKAPELNFCLSIINLSYFDRFVNFKLACTHFLSPLISRA